jgi:hypothetical protein
MNNIIPSVYIEGREVELLKGAYTNTGGLRAATLEFTLPLISDGYRQLWNKEVTFYANPYESTPIFRGYIKRVKEDFNVITVYAQDVLGYLVKAGEQGQASIALTDDENLDGLTAANAIRKAIKIAKLDTKIGTAYIGDTTPSVSSSRPPLRGTHTLLDIIKSLMGRAVDNSVSPPRTNIIKVVDDGNQSQLVIERESDTDSSNIKHIFTEKDNITNLKIVKRKVPTYVIVNGKNGVKGTFSHEGAIEAYDRNYLELTNESLKSPAECVDFAQKVFRANLITQYEYGINTVDGYHLSENDVVRVETGDKSFTGNYRVRGKKIAFTHSEFTIGININRKPPTLVEYIAQQDN